MKNPKFWFMLVLLVVLLVSGTVLAAVPGATDANKASAKIEPLVLAEMAEAGQSDFIIWMAEKADLSPAYALATKQEKGRFVFDALRTTAERTQKDVRAYLDAQGVQYKAFYIANKIVVYGGHYDLVLNVAGRADVGQITANHRFQLQEPFINPNPPTTTPTVIETNITFVNADDVWALGYNGAGTVMAGNDTGLDWDHPALINQYRGWNGSTADHNYNWWDATNTYPTVPNDGHGHGTHTSGTMVGDDGATHQIGMAPGADLIHCKNMDNFGSGIDAWFIECFQWDLAPWDLSGANPDPDMAPDAVNNSWGYYGGNVPTFQDEIAALQAAGVAVEVSAGNEGSGCGSLRSPGDYLDVITTGSVQHSSGILPGTITGFSSRGPSDLHPGEYFPDIMAPGENINSSLPGGGYSGPTWSGTSMSGPHVTGLIGLMWSASPALQGNVTETYDIIHDTAIRLVGQNGSNCGGDYTVGPNNDWGYGTIDALAAVNEAINRGGPNFTLTAAPDALTICAPATASYTVDLAQILGYNWPVNLSVAGNPPGTSANFVPGSVTPPGSSTLTIGNTAAGTPGTYTMTITGTGTDPEVKTKSDAVDLSLYTALPGAPTLVSPANGAVDVARTPLFTWNAVTQADTYELQVATDPGFSNVVYSATVDGTSHATTSALATLTLHYWRVRAVNGCGNGGYSAVWSFTTEDAPSLLLVDDDDDSPDVVGTYTAALGNLGRSYDLWDTNGTDNEPGSSYLSAYDKVIWFSGDQHYYPGPGAAGESALTTWLNTGGNKCLFISSQEYYWYHGLTSFMQNYLGVASATDDVLHTGVRGRGPFYGLGPYTLSYSPLTNNSDRLNPAVGAAMTFQGNNGRTGVGKHTASYTTVFLGFPWEALPTAADEQAVLDRFLSLCNP